MKATTAQQNEDTESVSESHDVPVRQLQQPSLLQDILALLIKIFVILTVLVLLFTFLFGIFSAKDMSMRPAVQAGDIVIFYRLSNEYIASDTVVLEYEGEQQIRRIIAVAGDTIDITEDGLFINGSLTTELAAQRTQRYEEGVTFPLTVPDGQVFVLADYRRETIDSRIYGTVETPALLGKVTAIIRQRDI